ncbi:flagellar protein FliT [Marinobacterium lutimaris]|uniref:Flagellar protein FliT n=1 Tax=Marinobacterium lutimaris TaxID=568106 RepID=A0A1H6BDL3_9GAMM|nr:flagellar protein FliT [Marinobacterium lutimaris]SEG58614.1 protein FliT [Marinobacterium lutimaris]
MQSLNQLALELLQITQALYDKTQAGELEPITGLQQQRATLVAELDKASRQQWPDEEVAEARKLIAQSRELEKKVLQLLTQKRDELGKEHNQLMRSKKASKAYGQFK